MTVESFPTANEFRSDTFTVPTSSMVQQAFDCATFGDSVYKEDESTLKLESHVAQLTGKEAALFCVSGTLSNQIGLRANLYQPPYSILCDYRAHVFLHEAGGLATLSQAMVHPVVPKNGLYLTVEDIAKSFTPDVGDIHGAPTKVISLENTLHGIIMPLEEIKRICEFARTNNIKLHLDGARLWNASAETGVSMVEYCSHFDSVSLCLSKSLGAPMGLVLVGDQSFIDKANHFKKQNGGGIRQAGIITAMAMVAIQENYDKLKRSHEYAKDVAKVCEENGIILEWPVQTNFVFIDLQQNKMDAEVLIQMGVQHGVKLMGGRLAFHFQNDAESVETLKRVLIECKRNAIDNPCERVNKKMY